ncbi:brain-enriched guanylate kinase-associated protein [Mustelus asterias]
MEQKAFKNSNGTRPLIVIRLMPSPNSTFFKSRSSSLPGNINIVPAAKMEKISYSQKQNEQLQKHQLKLQESESDTTRLYLETELQHAQEELKDLTEKLHRTQKHHTALQQVNQDLENKLHRMAQLHEEEKRNLSHKIITLCNQLTEAKITMDKLTENSQPAEIQRRVRTYTENLGSDIPGTVVHSSFFNTQDQVLEKPEPTCLSGTPISLSRQVLHGHVNTNKSDQGFPCNSDLYHCDTVLDCPAEQRRDRRQVRDVHFFQTQSFTDSSTETEDFNKILTSETLPNYAASTSSSSNSLSCTMTAENKGTTQAKTTLSPTQQVGLRANVYERKCNSSEEQGNKTHSFIQARPLQPFIDVAHGYQDSTQHCSATLPIDFSDSPPHVSWMSIQDVRVPKLYGDEGNVHHLEKNRVGQCKKVNMHYTNISSNRVSEKISSSSHTKQQLGNHLMKKTNNQENQFFTREDSFPDGEDTSQNNFPEVGFGTMSCQPYSEIDCKKQASLSVSRLKDTEDDPKTLPNEKNAIQTYIKNTDNVADIKRIVDVAPNISVKSLRRYPIKIFVVHNVSLGDVVSSSEQEKPSKVSGLYRKDSLMKAQLYGNLLN